MLSYRIMGEIQKVLDEETAGSSDRALAIVSASLTDFVLEQIFRNHFIRGKDTKADRGEVDGLFRANGPLSTASSKISLSFRLGLVTRKEHDLLDKLRKIRNEFAHSPFSVAFTTSPIKDVLSSIDLEKKHLLPKLMPLFSRDEEGELPPFQPPSPDQNPREYFVAVVDFLLRALTARGAGILMSQTKPPPDFDRPSATFRYHQELLKTQLKQTEIMKEAIEEAPDLEPEQKKEILKLFEVVDTRLAASPEHTGLKTDDLEKLLPALDEINDLIDEWVGV